MFSVTYNGLTVTPLPDTEIDIPFVELTNKAGTDSTGIPFVTISSQTPNPNELISINNISVNTLTPNTLTTVVPNTIYSSIKSLEIAGQQYTPVNSISEVTANTYYFNNITNTLLFRTPNTVPNLNQVKVVAGIPSIVSNSIDVPDFVSQYNLKGTISLSRSFENHPTFSLSLICNKTNLDSVRNLFSNYYTKYVFYDIPFRCTTNSITVKPLKKYPVGYYEFNISFQGWYQELINKQVFIKQNSSGVTINSPYSDPACQLNKPSTNNTEGTSATNSNNSTISLATLANKAGFNYDGYGFNYEYPKSSPPDTLVSFSSAIGDKPVTKGLYICYSNSAGITTPSWRGVSMSTNSDEGIMSETISVQKNIKPVEYNTIELTWDKEDETESSNSEDTKGNKAPEFEYKPLAKKVVITGDNNPTVPPKNDNVIKTLDLCFDKSGPRKNYIETTYLGSTVVKQFIRVYGYKYVASDIYDSGTKTLRGTPGGQWTIVKETTTTYLIDTKTGYILGNDVTGYQFGRYKVETDVLETVTLTEAEDKQPYYFNQMPIQGATRYLLRQYRDIYLDSQKVFPFITYNDCDPLTGQLKTYSKLDPSWIEPMFIAEEMTETNSFSTMADPANKSKGTSDPLNPPLIAGEYKIIRSKIRIYRSENTTAVVGTSSNGTNLGEIMIGDQSKPLDKEDKYTRYTSTFVAQDSSYNNSIEETKDEDSTGKPPQASYRPSPYTKKEDGTTQLNETKKPDPKKPVVPTYKYILTTPPNNPYGPIQGSISFSCKTQVDALLAAKTKIEIDDMQQNTQISIDTFFNPYIVEGSRYYFSYAGETYPCRVISNSSTLTVLGKDEYGSIKANGQTTLTLGVDSNLGNLVKLTSILQPPTSENNNNSSSDPITQIYDWYKGLELGSLIDQKYQTRTNF